MYAVSDAFLEAMKKPVQHSRLRGNIKASAWNYYFTEENIQSIAALMLEDVKKRIEGLGIMIEFDPTVSALMAKEGFDAAYGARPLRRAIVRMVEDAFSTELLEGHFRGGDRVKATAEDGKIQFSKQD